MLPTGQSEVRCISDASTEDILLRLYGTIQIVSWELYWTNSIITNYSVEQFLRLTALQTLNRATTFTKIANSWKWKSHFGDQTLQQHENRLSRSLSSFVAVLRAKWMLCTSVSCWVFSLVQKSHGVSHRSDFGSRNAMLKSVLNISMQRDFLTGST